MMKLPPPANGDSYTDQEVVSLIGLALSKQIKAAHFETVGLLIIQTLVLWWLLG